MLPALKDRTGVSFADLTTFGVGGPIARVRECAYALEVQDAVKEANASGRPWLVVGGGSNLLASEGLFEGDVIRLTGLTQTYWDSTEVRAAAGVSWDALVLDSVERGFAGLECMSGIPGDVGGAAVQNVGAYGQDISSVLSEVDVYDTQEDDFATLTHAECMYSYRASVMKGSARYIVLGVTLKLRRAATGTTVMFAELQRTLGTAKVSLAEVRAAVLAARRSKGMVLDAEDLDTRGAGSFFVNPVVSADAANAVLDIHPECPNYEAPNGQRKLAAAWLIEAAGFRRGSTRGRVGQSTKHALALVNRGGATGEHVWAYAREIASAVEAKFGVQLLPEPVPLGLPAFR